MTFFTNKTILVTGGAGFIGSHIVDALLEHNCRIIILDNLTTGSLNNIDIDNPKITFRFGDITDYATCLTITKNVDIVCHHAALGSVQRSITDPLSTNNNNVDGFLNILNACKNNNVKRIIYASSSSVYGDNKDKLKTETRIGKQLSPYAVSKYVDEIYAKVFHDLYGLETIGLRYFNVFGPKQNKNGLYSAVVPTFISQILNDVNPTIFGDGFNSRDFTPVYNVVKANLLAMQTDNGKCFGEVFNIGMGRPISIYNLFMYVRTYLKSTVIPIFRRGRNGDIANSCADVRKAQELLGYNPEVTFEGGLVKAIEFYRNVV